MQIEFAKYHVESALKAASEKAEMIYHDGHFKENRPSKHVQIGADNIQINKDSILTAYGPENIK